MTTGEVVGKYKPLLVCHRKLPVKKSNNVISSISVCICLLAKYLMNQRMSFIVTLHYTSKELSTSEFIHTNSILHISGLP